MLARLLILALVLIAPAADAQMMMTGMGQPSAVNGTEVLADPSNTELMADPTNAYILTH